MRSAWELQKRLQDLGKIPTIDEMVDRIVKIKDSRDRALIALLYWSAGRKSEVLDVKPEDVNTETVSVKKSLDEVVSKKCLVVGMPNRKNKQTKWKTLAMPLKRENTLCQLIQKYAEIKKGQEKLFNIKGSWTYTLTKTHTGFNPHFLRHIRLTHLRRDYDFHPMLLLRWAGWTDLRPARRYDEGRYQDFVVQL